MLNSTFQKHMQGFPASLPNSTTQKFEIQPLTFIPNGEQGKLVPLAFSVEDLLVASSNRKCLTNLPGETAPKTDIHLSFEISMGPPMNLLLMLKNQMSPPSPPVASKMFFSSGSFLVGKVASHLHSHLSPFSHKHWLHS